MEDVLRLVTQPCGNSNLEVPTFMEVPPTDGLMAFLDRELNKTILKAASASETLKKFTAMFDNQKYASCLSIVKTLQISKAQHNNLPEIENSRLHVYLQLANYAHFVMKQETAGYYNNNDDTRALVDLRVQILAVMCKLRELLQPNDEELKVFATQDIAGHLFQLETMNKTRGFKRAFCAVATQLMFDTIKRINIM